MLKKSTRNASTELTQRNRNLQRQNATLRSRIAVLESELAAAKTHASNEVTVFPLAEDLIDIGMILTDGNGKHTLNQAARRIIGQSGATLALEDWPAYFSLHKPDGSGFAPSELPSYRALHGETVKNIEMLVKPAAGAQLSVLGNAYPITHADGKTASLLTLVDISAVRESANRLVGSERLLRAMMNKLPVLIAYIDQDERYNYVNATYRSWFGVPEEVYLGKTVKKIMGDELYARVQPSLRRALDGLPMRTECEIPTKNGMRIVEFVGVPNTDGDGDAPQGTYILTSDITAAKNHERELHQLARLDPLTGLPNRRSYQEKLDDALLRMQKTGCAMALIFLDVDHFKRINDEHGHAVGDAVLEEFGRRVKSAVRTSDAVCRLAGDEFTVILEGLTTSHEAESIARKILHLFDAPFVIQDQDIWVSTSLGIAFTREGSETPVSLSKQADTSLYLAKQNGRATYHLCELSA